MKLTIPQGLLIIAICLIGDVFDYVKKIIRKYGRAIMGE